MENKTIIGFWILAVVLMNAAFLMHGGLTGNVVAKLFVMSEQAFSGRAYFHEGWNLISFPATPIDPNVSIELSQLSGNYSSLHYYETLDIADRWKAHSRSLTENAAQDLFIVSNKRGYWINMVDRSAIENSGTIGSVSTISLYSGWNIIGYPSNLTRAITSAFSSINGSYSAIYAYYANDTADQWKVYNPNIGAEFSDLTTAYPFYGYWVNATSNATLTIINS